MTVITPFDKSADKNNILSQKNNKCVSKKRLRIKDEVSLISALYKANQLNLVSYIFEEQKIIKLIQQGRLRNIDDAVEIIEPNNIDLEPK